MGQNKGMSDITSPPSNSAQPSLKEAHINLYHRARLKGIVNALLGLSLIYNTRINTSAADTTGVVKYFGYGALGAIFLIIGINILVGLYLPKKTFRYARVWMGISTSYSVFWLLALFVPFIIGKAPASAGIIILWGYWTYNNYLIVSDPGWGTPRIIKMLRDEGIDKKNAESHES